MPTAIHNTAAVIEAPDENRRQAEAQTPQRDPFSSARRAYRSTMSFLDLRETG